ncbi:MAG: cytochrome-c oxidase, cbb3-type subunit III [Proteobacteria bacterium]|uniref:cytochrome-c oxidase, cbb3-type subunit III n=1 Tax=Rudaea sp. TaxID=2136325 RepID=UPI001D95EB33|nr:cytochrome-c oxidase, cbb3-type subunit III [Pseudomonadota bacterium]MBS0567153.1 cytochrome-c oxidase, cbb3-type subunit III [Pseudomonadota bacterium]
MSAFWSAWVMFLIVLNLGITLFLFLWGQRVEIPTRADGTSGHVWAHGVLREGVRRLPLWWVLLSASMFVAGFAYLALYPGFGRSRGLLGWTSHDELAAATQRNDAVLGDRMQRYSLYPIEELARDGGATRMGHVLFEDNCAACHGREATGNPLLGAPNLADNDWLYGGDGKAIMTSILDGRHGVMPPWASLGEDNVVSLANYVLSLSGAAHDDARAAQGKALFATCAACHGAEGKGNPALGAPNLTDNIWLYGGDLASVEESIRHGRGGVMPAWRARLGENDARVIAAWIYSLSHGNAGSGAPAAAR